MKISIDLSVYMPMFNSKHIGWLPFESLIRQTNINFGWELIIAEELEYSPFGQDKIMEYSDRLKKIGCQRIQYIGLKDWMPLGDKTNMLIENTTSSSFAICGQSNDYYSPPNRLSLSHKIFKGDEYNWLIPEKAIYYNIPDGKVILHDATTLKRKDDVEPTTIVAGSPAIKIRDIR